MHAPLVHTYRALDLLPFDHPNWIGGLGLIGGRAGTDAVMDADLLLMLGTDYPYVEYLPKHGNVVQVDERAFALGRRTPVELGIVGSVRPAVAMLIEDLPQRDRYELLDQANAARRDWATMLDEKADPARSSDMIHPQAVARLVGDMADDDAVFVTDTGEVTLWAANWTRPRGDSASPGRSTMPRSAPGSASPTASSCSTATARSSCRSATAASPCCRRFMTRSSTGCRSR